MMSLFWYYRPEHTQGGRDPRAHCEVRPNAARHGVRDPLRRRFLMIM